MNIPDNYDLWEQHQAQQDKWLESRLVCEYCSQPIQEDFFYDINNEVLCKKCLDRNFRKEVEA